MNSTEHGRLTPGTPIPVSRLPSPQVLAAQEVVRREVAARWPESGEAVLRRVDRCVVRLLDRAAEPNYLASDEIPPGPVGNESGIEIVERAVVGGPRLALDPRWAARFAEDVWGLIALGSWELLPILEKQLGFGE